jgi:putative hydrolase of HD superfamily
MNYVNKKYVTVDEEKAVEDLASTLFFGEDIREAVQEFNDKKTRESLIAHDADQLSLILILKERGDLGNKYSTEWISYARQRLCTDNGRRLAAAILETEWSDWWFKEKGDWWVNGNRG